MSLSFGSPDAFGNPDRRGDIQAAARSYAIGLIERNKHLQPDGARQLAATLLWLACTNDRVGAEALRQASMGGGMITYHITGGGPGHGFNFRLILGEVDPRAELPPTPKHPLAGLPGGPKLH